MGLDVSAYQTAYKGQRADFHFHAGSYSGYNTWRDMLSRASMGVPAHEVWADPDKYQSQPFWRLIHFSDCEGQIESEWANRLAQDFKTFREQVLSAIVPEARDYFISRYDHWTTAFELASRGGTVRLH